MKTTEKLELLRPGDLVPAEKNPRKHTLRQMKQLRASLREFGFVTPVLVDQDNGIIAGHAMVEAAQAEGMDRIPCVRVEHLSPAQRKAYQIADNRLAELSKWDDDILNTCLHELFASGVDLMVTGFGEYRLSDALAATPAPDAAALDTDAPEAHAVGDLGTAIGAGVGALVGAASGAASRFGEQEDAFRSFVQGQVDGQLTRNDAFLDTGKTIAGSREQTFMAFAHRFGSEDQAGDYLERVRRMAIDTNYDYDEIVGYSKSLLNSYNPDDVFGVLATLSDASAGLNLDSSDVNMFIAGLSRMRTTGKAHAQYLNYFSERGVDVYDALAQDQGVDKATAAQMVSDGKITGDQAAQAILSYIDHTFGGLSDKLSTTYDALVDNFGDAEADIQAAAGDAYTDKRKMSIQSDIALLEGETGDKMKSMLSEIGTFKAELDNMQDMHYRDVMRGFFDGVMSEDLDAGLTGRLEEMHQRQLELMEIRESTSATIEEKMAAGAELDALYTEAQIMAETAYLQGEGAKITGDAMVQLAKSVGEASADAFENTGQWLGRRISEGITRGFKADALPTPSFAGRTSLNISGGNSVALSGRARAFGLDRVPHDDYAVRLHAGERVLTANQARQLDNSGGIGGGIAIQMYGTTIREEADIKRVAEELVSELQIAMAAKRP